MFCRLRMMLPLHLLLQMLLCPPLPLLPLLLRLLPLLPRARWPVARI